MDIAEEYRGSGKKSGMKERKGRQRIAHPMTEKRGKRPILPPYLIS